MTLQQNEENLRSGPIGPACCLANIYSAFGTLASSVYSVWDYIVDKNPHTCKVLILQIRYITVFTDCDIRRYQI